MPRKSAMLSNFNYHHKRQQRSVLNDILKLRVSILKQKLPSQMQQVLYLLLIIKFSQRIKTRRINFYLSLFLLIYSRIEKAL